jgi:hypothetical protein
MGGFWPEAAIRIRLWWQSAIGRIAVIGIDGIKHHLFDQMSTNKSRVLPTGWPCCGAGDRSFCVFFGLKMCAIFAGWNFEI